MKMLGTLIVSGQWNTPWVLNPVEENDELGFSVAIFCPYCRRYNCWSAEGVISSDLIRCKSCWRYIWRSDDVRAGIRKGIEKYAKEFERVRVLKENDKREVLTDSKLV